MKVKFFLLSFLYLVSLVTLSQENVNINSLPQTNTFDNFKSRLYVGGNFGAWIGTTTYLNVSPLLGFKVTENFSVGAGVTYNYFRQVIGTQKYVSTIYGGNVFARHFILENLFAQVGWDRLSVEDYRTGIINDRTWVDNILVGGGYKQPFSDRGNFIAMIFYNLNETPLSPYPNPIIQVGFNLGF